MKTNRHITVPRERVYDGFLKIVHHKKRIILGFFIILVSIVGLYVYSHYNPEDFSLFPKCPVYVLTGYKCPGCGSQRAFHHLFLGHFRMAFQYNPLMMLLAPYVLLGVYIEYIANQTHPLISRLRRIFFGKWALLVLAIIIALYAIGRNCF